MASQQESTGRETRQNRGQHLRVLLQMEKGRHLERSTSTRALPSAERSLLEDHPSSRTAGEAQNLLSERAGGDAGATSQPAQPPESVVPKQFLPSVPESAPPAPPSAAALKQPLPSAPDPAPIPAASKQPLQPTTVVDFCVEVNPEMNGIPAEVKFLECAQIWTQEANSNLRIGIRVSQDVEFVAGDFVSITHKAKQKAKTGNMTVVCVERRKDKLYLVGVPDKDLLPPPHAGPNQSSPYYSCPLLKSEWSIVVLKHSELNDSVNGRLKAAIVQYIANQAKKGNEGSLVEAPDSNAPYLRASARTKVARLNQREQSAQIERDKSLALKKKKRRTNALQKQKEEEEDEEETGEDEEEEDPLPRPPSKSMKHKKDSKPTKPSRVAKFPPAAAPVLPSPPNQVPPPGFHWAYLPLGSSHQWVLVQIAAQQQPAQPPPQQVQPLMQGGQTVSTIPSAPTVTGAGARPTVNFAITNIFPT